MLNRGWSYDINNVVQLAPKRAPFEDAERAYEAGRSSACLTLLHGHDSIAAAILRARAFLRLDRLKDALAELELNVPSFGSHRESAQHRITLAFTLARRREMERARAALVEADVYATFVNDPEMLGDVAYYKAAVAWMGGDAETARTIALDGIDERAPLASARLMTMVGLVHGVNGDLPRQIETLRNALAMLDRSATPDVHLEGNILYNIAAPAAELNLPGLREYLLERHARVRWNDETTRWEFWVAYQLAWLDALAGDHLSAFRRFRTASKLAPSAGLKAFALCGRAYLAREMDESLTTAECVFDAEAALSNVDARLGAGDEPEALLLLATIVARSNGAHAAELLDRYSAVRPVVDPTYSSTHRNPLTSALEAQAFGLLAQTRGDAAGAIRLLRDAHRLFISVGSTWRAAVAALDIYDITHEEDMFVFAREQAARVPHSWLARRLIQTSPLPAYHKDEIA